MWVSSSCASVNRWCWHVGDGVFRKRVLFPSIKTGDTNDSRHQRDPAALTKADGAGASSLQRCLPGPSPTSPHHPLQHRSALNPRCSSSPGLTHGQYLLPRSGVQKFRAFLYFVWLDYKKWILLKNDLNGCHFLESRPWPQTQIQRLPLQWDPSHRGLRWHHVHVSRVQPATSAPCGCHPLSSGRRVSQIALQQPAVPLSPRAPRAVNRDAGYPEASFWSCSAWKLECCILAPPICYVLFLICLLFRHCSGTFCPPGSQFRLYGVPIGCCGLVY